MYWREGVCHVSPLSSNGCCKLYFVYCSSAVSNDNIPLVMFVMIRHEIAQLWERYQLLLLFSAVTNSRASAVECCLGWDCLTSAKVTDWCWQCCSAHNGAMADTTPGHPHTRAQHYSHTRLPSKLLTNNGIPIILFMTDPESCAKINTSLHHWLTTMDSIALTFWWFQRTIHKYSGCTSILVASLFTSFSN